MIIYKKGSWLLMVERDGTGFEEDGGGRGLGLRKGGGEEWG